MIKAENSQLKIGDLITLDIGPIAHGGHFISRYKGQVIFVRHAITNEVANVKITALNSKLAFGDAIEILKLSEKRVLPPCKYSIPEGCGGCDFQHVSIVEQRELKKLIIKDQFKRIAKININPEVIEVKPESGLHWRTRLDLAISNNGKIGLYSSKTKKITEISECLIAIKAINELDLFKRSWNGDDRISVSVSSENEINVHRSGKNISGPTKLNEVVDEYSYNISPQSFWQSHKNAPKILIDTVMKFINLKLGDRVCDLYGGVGLFTAPILKIIGKTGEVHLIENNNSCVKDARKIFENNSNVIVHHGKVEQKIGKIKNIDVILLDPPRNGAGKQVLSQILDKKPRSIIYVSCDPASLARDSKILLDNSYSLDEIVGIDLFPMTQHIECVCSFVFKLNQ